MGSLDLVTEVTIDLDRPRLPRLKQGCCCHSLLLCRVSVVFGLEMKHCQNQESRKSSLVSFQW